MSEQIKYRNGYKYQLAEDYQTRIGIKPEQFILTPWIRLDIDGMISIVAGYAWDGPSGPTLDTADSMRGSLVHDALYQLMREGHLDAKTHRRAADRELWRICVEDGMLKPRADVWYAAVRLAAGNMALPENKKAILTAP